MMTKKKIIGFPKIVCTHDTYRVIRTDRRVDNFVFSWSVLYLCARVGEIVEEVSLPRPSVIVGFGFRLYPNVSAWYAGKRDLTHLRGRAFGKGNQETRFVWNLFASKSYVIQPRMCLYTGTRFIGIQKKSMITVKYSKLLYYLLPRLNEFSVRVTAHAHGGDSNINRSYLTYLYFFDTWFFLNISNLRSFSFSPTFLSWHWASPFLPFLDFSPKASFTVFDNFTPLYPFFFTFRAGRNLGQSLSSLISLTKFLFFITDYVDWVPYEGREKFNFWAFSSEQVCFERTIFVDSACGLKFELVPLGVMIEPDLGDCDNSRIPYHFYFNEADFLQALFEAEKSLGGEDRALSYIRLFAPIFLLIDLFLLRLFCAPQLAGFLHFLWGQSRFKLIDRAHSLSSINLVSSWVYTKIFLNGWGSRRFSEIFFVTYHYNNTVRPLYLSASLLFLLLHKVAAMPLAILLDCQFFKNVKFYFFSIKRLKFYFFRQKLINVPIFAIYIFIYRNIFWFWAKVVKSFIRIMLSNSGARITFMRGGFRASKFFFCLSFLGVGCVGLSWIVLSFLHSFWVITALGFFGLCGVGGVWGRYPVFGFRKAKEEEILLVRLYFNRQKLFGNELGRVIRRIIFSGLSFIICYRWVYWIYIRIFGWINLFWSLALLKSVGDSSTKFNFRKLDWYSLFDCIASLLGRWAVKNFYNQLYGAADTTSWGAFNTIRFSYGWFGWWRGSSRASLTEFIGISTFNRLFPYFMYFALIAFHLDGVGVVRSFSKVADPVPQLGLWTNNATLAYLYGSMSNLLGVDYKSKKKDFIVAASDSMLVTNSLATRFFLAKLGAVNFEFMRISALGLLSLVGILLRNVVWGLGSIIGDLLRGVLRLLSYIYWICVTGLCLVAGLSLILATLNVPIIASTAPCLYLPFAVYCAAKFIFICFVFRTF